MKHRTLVVIVIAAVVIAALSAATYTRVSNHIVLRGAAANGRTLTTLDVEASTGALSRPANAVGVTITLHGSNPNIKPGAPDLAAGSWTCSITQYAWQQDPHTMAGDAYYDCTGATLINFNQYADYCAPLLWGCTWQNGKRTFPGCSIPNPSLDSCPLNNGVNVVNSIPSGQLWRERSYVCAWGPPGTTSDCGTIAQQVQF